MSNESAPLKQAELYGPAKDFSEYCEAEFQRRRNSDDSFDEASYREAMNMVMRKLQALVSEAY